MGRDAGEIAAGRAAPVLPRLVGLPRPRDSAPCGVGVDGSGCWESLLWRGQAPISSPSSPSVPATRQRRNGDLKCYRIALKYRVNLKGLVEEMQYLDFNICIW